MANGCTHPTADRASLFHASDYISGERFEVLRCDACGLVRTSPPPDAGRISDYYPAGYYGAASDRRFPAPVELLQRALCGYRARSVERLAGGPGRVLDVGCGRGFLLDAFRRRGWEPHGSELDERSAAFAREVLGLDVATGDLDRWPWPDGTFDAVSLWHVLEHLAEPERALDEARRGLRPGGVLLVGVPNFASPEARLTGAGWFHLDVPRHVVHLTPEWLDRALHRAGFDVRRRSFFAPEYDVFSFVQSVENRLALRQNLLYDVLRRRAAKVLGSGAGPLQIVSALALAVPLGLAALPATTALGLARRGSSVTMYAVRRA
jgi:SAM-dependent methyltransferase